MTHTLFKFLQIKHIWIDFSGIVVTLASFGPRRYFLQRFYACAHMPRGRSLESLLNAENFFTYTIRAMKSSDGICRYNMGFVEEFL
jgi:hypothetical protein